MSPTSSSAAYPQLPFLQALPHLWACVPGLAFTSTFTPQLLNEQSLPPSSTPWPPGLNHVPHALSVPPALSLHSP